MIVVHAVITCATPGDVDRLVAAGRHAVAATRREKGCLGYTALRDAHDPCVLWAVECWRDEAALVSHMKEPHTAEIRAALKTVKVVSHMRKRYDSPGEKELTLG